MELTWNGCFSILNWSISSATRWTRNRLISGAGAADGIGL